MSQEGQVSAGREDGRRLGLAVLRVWMPLAIMAAGVVALVVGKGSDDSLEGASMLIGAGFSVFLLNVLFRIGVHGNRDRDREEAARRHYDLHGRWPDEG